MPIQGTFSRKNSHAVTTTLSKVGGGKPFPKTRQKIFTYTTALIRVRVYRVRVNPLFIILFLETLNFRIELFSPFFVIHL